MQFVLNIDVAKWLDSIRGSSSRQSYITSILRKEMALLMNDTQTTEGTNEESNVTYGAALSPAQIK